MAHRNGAHAASYPAPTIVQRIQGICGAAFIVVVLYACGLPGAVLAQARAVLGALFAPQRKQTSLVQRPINAVLTLYSPIAWRNAIVAHGLPVLLKASDQEGGDKKRAAIRPYAYGKTLEVGAGTGMTVKYYDADKLTDLFLVEPMKELHGALRQSVKAVPGLAHKVHIVPCGIEERSALGKHGVRANSLDTITLVQVLCSIPTPEEHIAYLQSLLKPGGQLLLFEHVLSDDATTARLQHLYNPLWTRISGGCNVNRDSAARVASLGGWSVIEITRPADESRGGLYTHALGRFVKA